MAGDKALTASHGAQVPLMTWLVTVDSLFKPDAAGVVEHPIEALLQKLEDAGAHLNVRSDLFSDHLAPDNRIYLVTAWA